MSIAGTALDLRNLRWSTCSSQGQGPDVLLSARFPDSNSVWRIRSRPSLTPAIE